MDGVMSPKAIEMKVVLLGEVAVGKTSIAHRYVRDEFREYVETTIGASYLARVVECGDGKVKISIWDTAGQETYHSLAPLYYRSAAACIITFDVTRENTFLAAKTWVKQVEQNGPQDVIMVLAANKVDQMEQSGVVNMEEARNYAKEIDALFVETSAKTGQGVVHVFQTLAEMYVEKMGPGLQSVRRSVDRASQVRLAVDDERSINKRGKRKCC